MSQIDIAFSNVQMNYPEPNPPATRIAFNFVLLQEADAGNVDSGNKTNPEMRLDTIASLDDEHTPGVFNTMNLRTPILGLFDQSYLQWKPICYIGPVRDITNSIDVSSYDIKPVNLTAENSTLENSILWSYYGTRLHSLVLQSTNISFGTEKDGWYNKTPHISW